MPNADGKIQKLIHAISFFDSNNNDAHVGFMHERCYYHLKDDEFSSINLPERYKIVMLRVFHNLSAERDPSSSNRRNTMKEWHNENSCIIL